MCMCINKRSWSYLVQQMILFLYQHPLLIYNISYQIQTSVLPKEEVSFIIFQYGSVQCEWSSSLNRCPPKISSFFPSFTLRSCFQEEKSQRPVDIEADVKEMERRKRVEAIMNSKVRDGVIKKKILFADMSATFCHRKPGFSGHFYKKQVLFSNYLWF